MHQRLYELDLQLDDMASRVDLSVLHVCSAGPGRSRSAGSSKITWRRFRKISAALRRLAQAPIWTVKRAG